MTSSRTSSIMSFTSSSSAPTSTPTGPGFLPLYKDYTLSGCYQEPDGARALPNLYADAEMTVEKCLDAAAGFSWAGIEYGQECWYGNQLNVNAAQVDLTVDNCGFLCPGDGNEYCGTGGHLVLYGTGKTPDEPSQPADVDGHPWYGCMTEATDARALSGQTTATDTLTLELCAEFCNGYTYFGVEYGRECYCGNSFNSGSVQAPDSDCNMVCPGNTLQFCGAGNRLSVYGA